MFFMQQYHTSHVTHATAVVITFSPISMPHHHVGIKPQSCINAELWVGPAEERGEPPTLPRIHEEKDSIVARHQPLQPLHVRSNLLYSLGYTRESEESGGIWPLNPLYTCGAVPGRNQKLFCHVLRLKHHIAELLLTNSLWCVNTVFLWLDITATTFFAVRFSAATTWGWLLFEGGIYFFSR